MVQTFSSDLRKCSHKQVNETLRPVICCWHVTYHTTPTAKPPKQQDLPPERARRPTFDWAPATTSTTWGLALDLGHEVRLDAQPSARKRRNPDTTKSTTHATAMLATPPCLDGCLFKKAFRKTATSDVVCGWKDCRRRFVSCLSRCKTILPKCRCSAFQAALNAWSSDIAPP